MITTMTHIAKEEEAKIKISTGLNDVHCLEFVLGSNDTWIFMDTKQVRETIKKLTGFIEALDQITEGCNNEC